MNNFSVESWLNFAGDSTIYIFAGLALAAILFAIIMSSVKSAKVRKMKKSNAEYRKLTLQTLSAVVNSIDARDPYSRNHSLMVAEYSVELGRRIGYSNLENLYFIALVHDIGKIGISDDILKRAGRLNPGEYAVMKQHTEIGARMLSGIDTIPNISDGAKYHHEHYDGSGYNTGAIGEDIPLVGRIIGVADAYAAMISPRSYRRGLTRDEAVTELNRCSGTQFDPKIVTAMVQMLNDGFEVSL